jgi:ATP-binding cassette subfamily B (MDR/TAP) protein 1
VASVFEILDHKSKIDYSSDEGVVITSVRGDIDFQNVWFKYPLRPNVQIFKDLSLRIPSGKVRFDQNKAAISTFPPALNLI